MRRLLLLFVLIPLAAVVVVLSVVNRAPVTLVLVPVGEPPAVVVEAPLFLILFAAVTLGAVLGGAAVWLRQARWRRAARQERSRAAGLEKDVERMRQRAQATPPQIALPESGRDAA